MELLSAGRRPTGKRIACVLSAAILAATLVLVVACPAPPSLPTVPPKDSPAATGTMSVTIGGVARSVPTATALAGAALATQTPTEPAPTPTAAPPTSTPTPAPPPPTPTPRLKPPPAAYKQLQDYPRPAGDTGYGFHITGDAYLPKVEQLQSQIIPLLNALGAKWVTVWASSGDLPEQYDSARLLVNSGFEVILRVHPLSPAPHPDYVPPDNWIRNYIATGIRYIVTGNEPNLSGENPSRGDAGLIARQWVRSADLIKAAGGIPLLYPMSPGGDVADHRDMLLGIFKWLKANDALDTLDGAGIAIHNRPLGKPLEVRDSTSFLEYEWIDDLVIRYAGKHLPLFGTEAGYAFGEQVLPIYPRVDGELHKQYNMGIITGFRDGRWRDSLFSQNFWILSGFGNNQFLGDWWVANPLNFGKDLPIVEALKALPKFERKFSAPGFK